MGTRTHHRSHRHGAASPGDLAGAVDEAVASCALGSGRADPRLVRDLATHPAPPAADADVDDAVDADAGPPLDPLDATLGDALLDAVAGAWRAGWQPADVHRAAGRVRARAHARLCARAIAHEAAGHPPATIPPRWRMQLDAIGVDDVPGVPDPPWVVPPAPPAGGTAPTSRVEAVAVAVETLALVRSLPPLPRLGPIPGETASADGRGPAAGVGPSWGPGAADAPGADPRILHKVTALLAKAESTDFPDEAESLTAKAQQLMTRHAIDRAHVDARRGSGPRVDGRRVPVDDPYAGARFLLLSSVAEANRCRAVWTKHWGFATVFGDGGDIDAVELLHTSLLVQATRAMVAEPRRGRASAGATRSFRHSFLVAFAHRVGARLREADAAVTADEARHSAALVPVFEQRRAAAGAALDAAYPTTRSTRMSANDAAGWHAGTRAADRAQLGLHPEVHRGG